MVNWPKKRKCTLGEKKEKCQFFKSICICDGKTNIWVFSHTFFKNFFLHWPFFNKCKSLIDHWQERFQKLWKLSVMGSTPHFWHNGKFTWMGFLTPSLNCNLFSFQLILINFWFFLMNTGGLTTRMEARTLLRTQAHLVGLFLLPRFFIFNFAFAFAFAFSSSCRQGFFFLILLPVGLQTAQ